MTEESFVYHRSEQFAMTPRSLVLDMTISHGATRLYDFMCMRGGPEHTSTGPRENAAGTFKTSPTTITAWQKQLAAKDWIVVEREITSSGRKANRIHVFQDQNDAIHWRVLHDQELDILPKPEATPAKGRQGIGGRNSHKPKETRVNVGSQKKLELTAPENLSSQPYRNLDKDSLDKSDSKALNLSAQSAEEREPIKVICFKEISGKVEDHPGYVYIGRHMGEHRPASIWANPYKEGQDGTRLEVVAKFLRSLVNDRRLLSQIPTLRGKTLVCWCDPRLCHGHVLKVLAEMSEQDFQAWTEEARNFEDSDSMVLAELLDFTTDAGIKDAWVKAQVEHRQAKLKAENKTKQEPYKDTLKPVDGAAPEKSRYVYSSGNTSLRHILKPSGKQTLCGDSYPAPHLSERHPDVGQMMRTRIEHCTQCEGHQSPSETVIDEKPAESQTAIQQWAATIKPSDWYPINKKMKIVINEPFPSGAELHRKYPWGQTKTTYQKDYGQNFRNGLYNDFRIVEPEGEKYKNPTREVIDAYYDGFPEAIRPTYRTYTGHIRSAAEKWRMAGHTAEQMKAVVEDQYKDPEGFWPNKKFRVPIGTVLENDTQWIGQLKPAAAPQAEAEPETDEEFTERIKAKYTPQQDTGWDRRIDRTHKTWWAAELGQLKVQLNASTFKMHLARAQLVEAHDHHFWIRVSNPYERAYIEKHLLPSIKNQLEKMMGVKDIKDLVEITVECEEEEAGITLSSSAMSVTD